MSEGIWREYHRERNDNFCKPLAMLAQEEETEMKTIKEFCQEIIDQECGPDTYIAFDFQAVIDREAMLDQDVSEVPLATLNEIADDIRQEVADSTL